MHSINTTNADQTTRRIRMETQKNKKANLTTFQEQ